MSRRSRFKHSSGDGRRHVEHRGVSGVLSSAGAGLISIIAGLALLPLVISTVGSAPYGLWLLISAVSIYLQYADIGVGSAIVHFGSRARSGASGASFNDYVTAGLVWNTLVALPVVPIFAIVATHIAQSSADAAGVSSRDSGTLAVIGTVMLAVLLISPFASALIGAGLLPLERRNQTIGVLIRCVGTIVACLVLQDVIWVAVAEALAATTPHLLALISLARRRLTASKLSRETFRTLRTMLRYSIKAFGVAVVGATILQFGTILVGTLLGPSDVTYFNAAFRVYTAARQLLTWIVDPFRSTLSRKFVDDSASAVRIAATLCTASLAASILGAGSLIFGSYDLIRIWLGGAVPTATVALTMVILLSGYIVNSLQIPLVPAGDASGRPGAFFPLQLGWLVAYVALAFLLTPIFGIAGVAAALTAPLLVVGPIYLWRARTVVGLRYEEWQRSGIFVVAAIGIIATCAASCASVIQAAMDRPALTWQSASTFVAAFCVAAIVARKKLPSARVRELLQAKL